jgi:endoglucanase
MRLFFLCTLFLFTHLAYAQQDRRAWIRINQLGYTSQGVKVAVFAGKQAEEVRTFHLKDARTKKTILTRSAGKDYGVYGPFVISFRLDFSSFTKPGTYYIEVNGVRSPEFRIATDVYKGSADFALRYMRQQRSGYNPFLKDSCHTNDGYTLYGPMPDHTRIDVSGGWHDATDYLQYATTSANATYHLLAAYRDFKKVFIDQHLENGDPGRNGRADVLDEAAWGLRWLLKMHPRADWMFNQIADDRDHAGFRLPNRDTVDYGFGPGKGRPVYFISGEVQGLGKYKNRTTGTSSTAGKFASSFALASVVYRDLDTAFAHLLHNKARTAYQFALRKPGVTQTAPNKAPYFYEEDNWIDDMELAAAALFRLTSDQSFYTQALCYSEQEKVTPWLEQDTARHYQYYPFHNFGHYELAVAGTPDDRRKLGDYYRMGIDLIWQKAKMNAFYRGIPFIWCSNNLTVSFAIQCYLYRQLTGDDTYVQLEQACFDWIFGCNPWGTSMVYGLPSWGDTPTDPHSSFTLLENYPLDGGLVDGPVSGYIYDGLIGISLSKPDEYAEFQSTLAVYHDDFGDYSTNEPTMDGTASLIYLLAAKEAEVSVKQKRKK